MKNNDLKPYGATIQDVQNTANDLRKLIDEKVSRNELEKHYAAESRVLKWGITAVVALISVFLYGYLRLDNKIDSKFEKLENRILDVFEKRK